MFYTPMSAPDPNEQLIAGIYHALRSEAKKAKRRNADGIARVVNAMGNKKPEQFSNIPPGWDGEEWGEAD